jgi:ABC-type glycerol-3-phosphate transport system permease component
MTVPTDPLEPIKELLRKQPWYQRFSNTVTATVGSLVGLVWLGTSLGFEVPDDAQKWGFVVIAVLTTLGVYKTPNGLTNRQLNEIEAAYVGRHQKPE